MPHKRSAVARRPPTGTVAFLFSDIEGSTARWEAHRDAMQDALRRHDALLESSIESHGGYVFKTIGDAYCAAFHTLREAVEAAVDAQRRLGAQDWSPFDGLRVRMALHVGSADERAGDYFGPTVNRVARMLSIGQGGQILLSGIAADVIAADLPAEHSVHDLGSYLLKGLKEPERMCQLNAPGLITTFRPLRTAEAFPNNLPRQATTFVGRSNDLREIIDLLRAAPLVTIVGTGGVGKTRVALQVAADVASDLDDGVWFVNLAPIGDATLVASTILSTLEIAQAHESSATDVLLEHLKSRRLLLVLDNCEHVVGEVASVASAIVAQCRQMTILATSRETLNVPGERVYRLPTLSISDAVELFAERARAIDPEFQVSEHSARVMEDICRRLDGIALAVELSVSRLRMLSLDELSSRLHQRFRVLTGGSRAAPARQQTMRALIDWSYELLSDDEKTFFRRMAIFAGGFSLEAASEVCTGSALEGWRALDLLTSLADKSLLLAEVKEGSQRYGLLQSIQEYARARLEEHGEAQPLSARHAAFFGSLAEAAYQQWMSGHRADWLTRIAPDLDNLRACLVWTLRREHDIVLGAQVTAHTTPLFLRLSLLQEAIAWCQEALRAAAQLPAQVEARLQYGLSMLQNNLGALGPALSAAQRAAELYRGSDDRAGLVRALSQLAQQYARQSRVAEAMEAAAEALAGARKLTDPQLLATTLRRCAFALRPDQIDRAREQFAESVALFRATGEDAEVARTLSWWAESEGAASGFERAVELLEEGLPMADRDSRMYMVNNIAGHALSTGRCSYAAPYAREALVLASEQQHALLIATAIAHLSAVCLEKDAARAARLYGYAQARFGELAWDWPRSDAEEHRRFMQAAHAMLEEEKLTMLFAEGAQWGNAQALQEAASV